MNIVLYDFDNTLTNYDTMWSLGLTIARHENGSSGSVFRFVKLFAELKAHLITNNEFKIKFAESLLMEKKELFICSIVQEYITRYINTIINHEAWNSVNKHRSAGHSVILVSSNYEFFVREFINILGLDDVIATRAEVRNGVFSGKLVGETCIGIEKVVRAVERCGVDRVRNAIAYGDSSGDHELLRFVREGYLVKTMANGGLKVTRFN
jgi:phosphatidylglycerophosphatase C